MSKATFGVVTEIHEAREIRRVLDEEGTITSLEPGDMKTRFKIQLKNTMGETLEIWVDAPKEADNFFAP